MSHQIIYYMSQTQSFFWYIFVIDNSIISVIPKKKDCKGPACQSFFWFDTDKDRFARFNMTQLILYLTCCMNWSPRTVTADLLNDRHGCVVLQSVRLCKIDPKYVVVHTKSPYTNFHIMYRPNGQQCLAKAIIDHTIFRLNGTPSWPDSVVCFMKTCEPHCKRKLHRVIYFLYFLQVVS